jgi:hypothetical protein
MDGRMDGFAHLSKYSTVPCKCIAMCDHRIFNRTVGKIIDAFQLLMTFTRPYKKERETMQKILHSRVWKVVSSPFCISSSPRSQLQHEDKPRFIVTVVPCDGDLDIISQKDRDRLLHTTHNTVFNNNSSNNDNFLVFVCAVVDVIQDQLVFPFLRST